MYIFQKGHLGQSTKSVKRMYGRTDGRTKLQLSYTTSSDNNQTYEWINPSYKLKKI